MRAWIAVVWAGALIACAAEESGTEQSLDGALRSAGFDLEEGAASYFFVEDCAELPTCFGNNATTPYLLFHLPAEAGDSATQAAGSFDVSAVPRVPDGMSPAWRLDADEVVLLMGETPPEVKYYSFVPYAFSRQNSSGERVPVFASLTDAINQRNISVSGDSPFGQKVAFVVASDEVLAARASDALSAVGYAGAINRLVIASEQVLLGEAEDADTFLVLGRTAVFADPAAREAYFREASWRVLRLTHPDGSSAPSAMPTREAKGSGQTEAELKPALDALDAAIVASRSSQTLTKVAMAPADFLQGLLNPQDCLDQVAECRGDVSDAVYSIGPLNVILQMGDLRLSETADEHFVVFGVNHEASGKATYANLIVMHADRRTGVAGLDSDAMKGSAARFLPDHPEVDKLFALDVRRDCGGEPYCITVPSAFPGVAPDENLVFMGRAYLDPEGAVAPDPSELLAERIYHVK